MKKTKKKKMVKIEVKKPPKRNISNNFVLCY